MSNRSDNFNRTSGAVGTPSDSGSAWVSGNGNWQVISDTLLYDADNGDHSVVVLEASSAVVTVQVTLSTGVNARQGLALRYADTSNYVRAYFVSNSSELVLTKLVAGVETVINSKPLTATSGDILKVSVTSSNLYTVYKNGSSELTGTDSAGSTNTKHGVYSHQGGSSNRWDDFSITDNSGVLLAANSGTYTQTGTATVLRPGSTTYLRYRK